MTEKIYKFKCGCPWSMQANCSQSRANGIPNSKNINEMSDCYDENHNCGFQIKNPCPAEERGK